MNAIRLLTSFAAVIATLGVLRPALAGDPGPSTDPGATSLSRVFTWSAGDGQTFIKPVLQLSSSVVGYFPDSASNADLADRTSTLLIARFGLEGRALGVLGFKSVWERNLGYNISRNGPLGTSIWEGTGSFSTRETYLELTKWGLTLTAGIFTEPASVDYTSAHILDMFGMDPFVRDPLLQSGANLGQGVMLRYALGGFSLGLSYTGGNPLVNSTSHAFGGDVTASGTLYDAPLRDISAGLPGSNIAVDLISPSLTWQHDFGVVAVGARAAAQLYFVDADVTSTKDRPLDGFNYRLSVQVSVLDDLVRVFGGYAQRGNRQLSSPDLTRYKDDFEGRVWNVGVDFNYGDFGVGGAIWSVRRLLGDNTAVDTTYVNIGASYWIVPGTVAAGLRYASVAWDTLNISRVYVDAESLIASLRLLL